jgi:hypothetical protein
MAAGAASARGVGVAEAIGGTSGDPADFTSSCLRHIAIDFLLGYENRGVNIICACSRVNLKG